MKHSLYGFLIALLVGCAANPVYKEQAPEVEEYEMEQLDADITYCDNRAARESHEQWGGLHHTVMFTVCMKERR